MIAMAAATATVMGDKGGALLQAGAIGPIYRDIAGTISIRAPAAERDAHSRLKSEGAPHDLLVRPADRRSVLIAYAIFRAHG